MSLNSSKKALRNPAAASSLRVAFTIQLHLLDHVPALDLLFAAAPSAGRDLTALPSLLGQHGLKVHAVPRTPVNPAD